MVVTRVPPHLTVKLQAPGSHPLGPEEVAMLVFLQHSLGSDPFPAQKPPKILFPKTVRWGLLGLPLGVLFKLALSYPPSAYPADPGGSDKALCSGACAFLQNAPLAWKGLR